MTYVTRCLAVDILNKIDIRKARGCDRYLMNRWLDMNMNIALRRFLHNHGNIATEGRPKLGLCPTLISNDFKGFL